MNAVTINTMSTGKIKILAISGSLRASSSNTKILKAIERLVPGNIEFNIYPGLSGIPHFDDADDVPAAVSAWRKELQEADAVLICTPEYAFGVPGTLKNALDWTVSSGELVNKPLALITASTGGDKAHAAFLQIFTALSAKIPEGGSLLIPFIRSKINAVGEISDVATLDAIKKTVASLIASIGAVD
jgi:chromate reductase, NAD(P)H dehydrogenase (quinone)